MWMPEVSVDLWRKDTADRSPLAVAVGAILIVFSAVAFAIYSPVASSLDAIASTFPEEILSIVGEVGPGGYVVSELFNVVGPLFLVAFALIIGSTLVAGEEEDGTMSLLLAHPVTRLRVIAAKCATLLSMVLIATALFWIGVTLSAAFHEVDLDQGGIAATCLHLLALSACFGLIALAAGAATGRPGIAGAISGTIAALSYLAASMLPLAGLEPWAQFSPWYYYNGSEPLTNGLNPLHLAVLLGIAALAAVLAVVTFSRRDLRG